MPEHAQSEASGCSADALPPTEPRLVAGESWREQWISVVLYKPQGCSKCPELLQFDSRVQSPPVYCED